MTTGRSLAVTVGVLAIAGALLHFVFSGSLSNPAVEPSVDNASRSASNTSAKRDLSAFAKEQLSDIRQPTAGYCLVTFTHATSGKPVAGVAITPATSPHSVILDGHAETTKAKLSDKRGRLVVAIRDFEASRGKFWAFKPGFYAKRGLISKGCSEVGLTLRPCIRYSIHVADAEGKPLPGVRLSVHRGPGTALKNAKRGITVRDDGAWSSWVGVSGPDGSCVIDGVHLDGVPAYISIESPGWLPIGNLDWSDGLSREAPSVEIQLARALYGVAKVANAKYIAHSFEKRAFHRAPVNAICRAYALQDALQRETGAPIVHVMLPAKQRLKSIMGKVWTEKFAAQTFTLPLHEYHAGEPIKVTSIRVDTSAPGDVGRLQLVVEQPSGARVLAGMPVHLERRGEEPLYMTVLFGKDPVVLPAGEYFAMLATPAWLAGARPQWQQLKVTSGKCEAMTLKCPTSIRKVRLSVTMDGGGVANGINLKLSSPVTLGQAVLSSRQDPLTCFLPVGPVQYELLGRPTHRGTFMVSPGGAEGDVEDIKIRL